MLEKEDYERLLAFSREMANQNTMYLLQQKELHNIIKEEVVPNLNLLMQNQINTESVNELFDKDVDAVAVVKDLKKLLRDEDYNVMGKIKSLTFWIKFIVTAWTIFGIVTAIYGVKHV